MLFFISVVAGPGCANIIPPAGGYRDSLPPRLVEVSPPDRSLRFREKRITFTFDEYVEVQNVQHLIVSPLPQSQPIVEGRLKTVTIRLRDSLEANTTYSFNFNRVIKDINEGNELRDFVYVVSTGSSIDSLELTGSVVLAENAQVDSTLTVMLHRNLEDSAVVKERPRYIARLDGQGRFRFRFLSPGTYAIYALKDEGTGYRYTSTKQLFAFADSAIVVNGQTPPVKLYAYAIPAPPAAAAQAADRRNANDKRLKYQVSGAGSQDLLTPFRFQFETPLQHFDSSRIRFTQDTLYTPVTSGYTWNLDSTRKVLTFTYPWPENTSYSFIMEKDFATDTLGHQLLKDDTLHFTTKKRTDYGQLRIRFRNLDLTQHPVLLFMLNNEVKSSFPLGSVDFYQPLFPPGEYEMRILKDDNRNGKWDPGDFFGSRLQPEKVTPIERTINVKPNWENEFEIDINAPARPRTPGSMPGINPRDSRRPGLQ